MTADRKYKFLIVPALVLCLLLPPAAHAGQDNAGQGTARQSDLSGFLNALGNKLSGFKTLKTDFVQEKEMALFSEKIVLKGRIYLQKPDRIAWHVDRPLRYSVLVTDQIIRQWDEDTNRVQEISLSRNPVFQNVLNQLTMWFSGDYGALLDNHEVRLLKKAPVVLECTPLGSNISRKVIKTITLTFREDQAYLQQIRIQELSGDITTIKFKNTLLDVPLDSGSFEVRRGEQRGSRTGVDGRFAELDGKYASGRKRHVPSYGVTPDV